VVTYLRHADVPVSDLTEFPGNPRTGDDKAIRDSLRRFGQYRALVIREHDDGTLTVLAGNHTRKAIGGLAAEKPTVEDLLKAWPAHKRQAYEESARAFCEQLRRGTARCEIIACSDDEAGRINAADNKYGELPDPDTGERYDSAALADLLASFDGDFGGTGWTAEEFEDLTSPADSDSLPDPGDAGTDDDDGERWGVIVECSTEAQQVRLLETLSGEGYNVRAIVS
jgi:hypothetical protein